MWRKALARQARRSRRAFQNWKFPDPTIRPSEKIEIEQFLHFLREEYNDYLNIHCCFSTSELTHDRKHEIQRKAHGSIANQHFGENESIEKARQLGEWKNMETDVINFVKRCSVCQLQKTTRIKMGAEAIPGTPRDPNDKISIDIFAPLPETIKWNKYILIIQAQLIIYIFISSLYHIFGAPKNILTDQGANSMSELIQNFKNLFRIKHIKTTPNHTQRNGSFKRAHSVLKDLLITCIEDTKAKWNVILKIISLAYDRYYQTR